MTLRTSVIQIGLDTVTPATNNFTIKAIADGSLKIGVGNHDSHTNVITLNSSGALSLTTSLSVPVISADAGIYLNSNTINSSYSMPAGKNGMSAGPIVLADGVSITVADGCNWTIV